MTTTQEETTLRDALDALDAVRRGGLWRLRPEEQMQVRQVLEQQGDRTRCPRDFTLALTAVDGVLAVGEPIHRGRWRRQSLAEHFGHLAAHVGELTRRPTMLASRNDAVYEDVSHTACRALMLMQRWMEDDRRERR